MPKTIIVLITMFITSNLYSFDITHPGEIIRLRIKIMKIQALNQCGIKLSKNEIRVNLVPVVNNCKAKEGVELLLDDPTQFCIIKC